MDIVNAVSVIAGSVILLGLFLPIAYKSRERGYRHRRKLVSVIKR